MATPRPFKFSWLLLAVASVGGALVYQFFVVFLNGYLAAIAVPAEYFVWFGKPKQELALAVLHFGTGLSIAILVSGAALFICGAFRNWSLPFLAAIFVGMFLCYLYWAVSFLLFSPAGLSPDVKPYSAMVIIKSLLLPPWWTLPTVVAPWLGVACAAWLLRRRSEA